MNAFIFGHGPMTISLADVHMLTGLQFTRALQPFEFLGTGSKKLKIFRTGQLYQEEPGI
jgi:hypothetical protein